MVDRSKVEQLLAQYFRLQGEVEIMEDGGVNVDGHVVLIKTPPKGIIPVKFGIVDGIFSADNKGLVSLRNSPDHCENLFVRSNRLTSLEHCTIYTNILGVDNNLLTSLAHAPEQVGEISAFNNPLTSLVGLPEDSDIPFTVELTYDAHLPLLRLIHAEKVHVGHPGGGYARLKPFEPVNSIINKYVGQGKPGAIKAAAELVRAGFRDNARW